MKGQNLQDAKCLHFEFEFQYRKPEKYYFSPKQRGKTKGYRDMYPDSQQAQWKKTELSVEIHFTVAPVICVFHSRQFLSRLGTIFLSLCVTPIVENGSYLLYQREKCG